MGRAVAIVIAAVAGLCGAAACVSLAGLSGGEEPTVDAGDAADATPPDPCRHAFPPDRPTDADDPSGDVGPIIVAVNAVSLRGTLDGGTPIGFDLDGVCTCFPDARTAHAGKSSCIPPDGSDDHLCDGDGGADFQLGQLLAAYPGFLTGGRTSFGGSTLLLEVTQYNGRANDASVFVALVASAGIYDNEGCGPDAGIDAGEPPYAPTQRGCDKWTIDPSYVLPGTTQPLTFLPGYVVDHVLVLPASSKPLTLVVGGAPFPLASTVLTARLVALDDALAPLSPQPEVGARFRLEDGLVAGRVTTGDMLRGLAISEATTGTGPLCKSDALFEVIKTNFVCPAADVVSNLSQDFTNKSCNALSLAAAFEARPAQIGATRSPDVGDCGAPTDPKYEPLFDCNQ